MTRAGKASEQAPAAEVMQPGPTTVRAHEDLDATRQRITEHHVAHLLVTTRDGTLLGVEVDSTVAVDEWDTTCCYTRQDKFWVTGTPGASGGMSTLSWPTARHSGAKTAARAGTRPSQRSTAPPASRARNAAAALRRSARSRLLPWAGHGWIMGRGRAARRAGVPGPQDRADDDGCPDCGGQQPEREYRQVIP